MDLENMGDKAGLGIGHLKNLKNHASFLFRDGLKIARLAFVDVSAAELMTEDATNVEEWGPTTKTMASISDAAYNSEDYLRIVRVLHKRFFLDGKKYWKQIHKSLILLEYLLTHGPDHLVLEFREDKDRIEKFTRLVYVDEFLVDRGSVIRKKAKQVLQLLMDEKFYKDERRRALKISKGISGFGSQSLSNRKTASPTSSEESFTRTLTSRPLKGQVGDDSTSLLVENEIEPSYSRPDIKKCYSHPGSITRVSEKWSNISDQNSTILSGVEASSLYCQRKSESTRNSALTSAAIDSPNSSSMTSSTSTDWHPFDDSPMSAQSCTSPTSSIDDGSWTKPSRIRLPIHDVSSGFYDGSCITATKKTVEFPSNTNMEVAQPGSFPSISLAESKCIVPPPPPGGSKVGRRLPRSPVTVRVSSDLIDL